MITTGQIPYLHVVSQINPDWCEDVLCDFSTDPPDYLTAGGQRLGAAPGPATAAADPSRVFHVTSADGM